MTATLPSRVRDISGISGTRGIDTRANPTAPVADRIGHDERPALTRQPWTFRTGTTVVAVRPAGVRDLPAVALLHRRCTARSLLDRYHQGGRPPTAAAIDAELRNPYAFVATVADGSVIATATVKRDPSHGAHTAEVSLLVEDAWQRRGVGSSLLSHLAGVAQIDGFTELIAYPATAVLAAQRLMIEIGRTRMVPDARTHLHTYLREDAALGLGSVRQRLAG